MNRKPFLPSLVAVVCFVAAFFFTGTAAAQPAQAWEFEVRLDGKKVGEHTYTLDHSDASIVVTSDASFDVKFLFVTALKYRHSGVETWQQDCLTSIYAHTRSNSKRQKVLGGKEAESLRINSSNGETTFDDCVQTFAYWNPSILDADKLLNSQTGDYVDVEVTPLGNDLVMVGKREIVAHKYALRSSAEAAGKPIDLVLWYSADSRKWLALESTVAGGRLLRYEPVRLPGTEPQRSAALQQSRYNEEQR